MTPSSSGDSTPRDYALRSIPGLRLAALTATVAPDALSEHVEPMFVRVRTALQHESGALETPIATYEGTEDGLAVVVGHKHPGPPPAGLDAVDLPAVEAVCGVHLGPMATVRASWQDLHRWVIDHGYEFAGPCRELYVRARSEDQFDWVTELQQPVRRTS